MHRVARQEKLDAQDWGGGGRGVVVHPYLTHSCSMFEPLTCLRTLRRSGSLVCALQEHSGLLLCCASVVNSSQVPASVKARILADADYACKAYEIAMNTPGSADWRPNVNRTQTAKP